MMNTARITEKCREIEHYSKALSWLEEFGGKLDPSSVSIRIEFLIAGSIRGAEEAAEVLKAYAALNIPDLVLTSAQSCRNTIEMARDAIREELDRT